MSEPLLKEAPTAEEITMSPGEIIAEMKRVRDEKSQLKEREKMLNDIWRTLEAQLIILCDKMGMKRMTSDIATATVTEELLPMVDDWDEFYQYILKEQAVHMLQRRVSTAAFRELMDAGIEVPGLTPYKQRKISLRKR